MREIKLRAWDYGLKRFWTKEEMDEIGGFYYTYGVSEFDSEEFDLVQYTGLKDKNGKEICEGDIVNTLNYGIGYIEWHTSQARWGIKAKKRKVCISLGVETAFNPVEVSGNIHENPDLLENNK